MCTMEVLPMCRICLSTEVSEDISNLKSQQSDKTCHEIMLFCLDIQVDTDFEASAKLCLACFRKIIAFYNFKLLALKNDAYFKYLKSSTLIKSETYLDEDIKISELSNDSYGSEISLNPEIKLEPVNNEEHQRSSQSDDELLSEIKKIKYEFIPVNDKTKENESLTTKKKIKKEQSKPLTCKECGKSVKNLKTHMQIHVPKDFRIRVQCSLCDKTFSSYQTKYKHEQNLHLRGIKRPCPICNKMVKDVKRHNRHIHDMSGLRHKCDQCGRCFSTPSQRTKHMTVHTKERPYACDVCDKRFSQMLNVSQHKRLVHDKQRLHLCQFCSKTFASSSRLRTHLRSHTNERPYKCTHCDKAFVSTTLLKNHMYTHSNEKTFICQICNKSFAASRYLWNHMLTHTRVKRWQCRYCDMKFHRSDHRTQHEAALHKKHMLSTKLSTYN